MVVVLATVGLVAFAVALLGWKAAPGRAVLAPAGSLLAGVFATTCSVYAARGSRGRQRLAWTVLSTGLVGWTAGQAVWCYVALAGELPVSDLSAANLGFLILPLCALATAAAIPSRDDARFGIGLLVDGLLITASLLVVLILLPLDPAAQASQTTLTVPRVLLATAAGVYVGLVALTFIVVKKAEAGRKLSPTLMMLGWGLIALAGLVHVARDSVDRGPNDLVVLGWAGGMYFVALSGITSRPGPEPDLGFSRPSSRASLWLPYLPVMLAIVVGTVHFWPAYRGEAFVFSVCVVLFVTTLVRHILLLERKQRLLAAVSDASLRDPLTGLANHRLFDDRLAHALRLHVQHSVPVNVLTVSVDDFKLVNDTLGYDVGDELLRGVGERIQHNVDDSHTIARMSGDEFAILVEDRPDVAIQVANGVARSFEEPVDIDHHRLDVRLSIGMASAESDLPPLTPGDLLKQADAARSWARLGSATNVQTFTPEMGAQLGNTPTSDRAIARLQLLGELRRAIENGTLTLLYQPKFSTLTGSVSGVEALVRWQHPRFGVLGPDEFLPLVRAHGLMHALTDLVLSRAVADAAAWHEAGAAIAVAINLAAPSLDEDALPDRIMSVLGQFAMSPSSLTIEITEDLVVADLVQARAVLNRLRDNGIRVAIDDFGSGYATLTYLRELPADEVKLGHDFIAPILHDDRAATIARSVIELASAFGIASVAEGVEDLATAQRLRDYGCDAVQGNFFCPPLPAAEIPRVPANSALAAGDGLR